MILRTFTLPHLTLMHPSFLNAPWYPLRCSTSIHSPVHTSSISIYSTAAETYCQPYLVPQCTNAESNKSSIQSLGHINITSSITKWLNNHPKPISQTSKSSEASGSLQWDGLLQYIHQRCIYSRCGAASVATATAQEQVTNSSISIYSDLHWSCIMRKTHKHINEE